MEIMPVLMLNIGFVFLFWHNSVQHLSIYSVAE